MKADFRQTIEDIESEIVRLESQGISIKHLNQSVADLKRHVGNIEAIENNIDAVREEVIDRIKKELDENKVAGRFSIFGFWVGAIALVLTIALGVRDLIPTLNSNIQVAQSKGDSSVSRPAKLNAVDFPHLAEQVDVMSDRVEKLSFVLIGLDRHYVPAKDEFLIHWRMRDEDADTLSVTKDVVLRLHVTEIKEVKVKGKIVPTARLEFLANNRKITSEGLLRYVQINHDPTLLVDDNAGLYVTEKDTLAVFNMRLLAERIFRRESKTLPIADDQWAVLFRNLEGATK